MAKIPNPQLAKERYRKKACPLKPNLPSTFKISKVAPGNPWKLCLVLQLYLYTYNGRGAIYHILRALRKRGGDTVLLPAFHCIVLVEAVLRAGYKVRFYGVQEDFQPDPESFLSQLSSDVVCAIAIRHYQKQ